MDDKSKKQALDYALSHIKKKCGPGAIMRLGTKHTAKVEAISTGSLSLDRALGVGGVPRGRVVEIFGAESSGKTTLALHIIANCQKNKGTAVFIDAEHALDPTYAKRLGVDLDALLVSQPDSGEQALEIASLLVQSNAIDVIVIDSVAALVPQAELNGEMGDHHVGLQARLMSQALRKLTGNLFRSNTCAVFINQTRSKIGGYGNPEVTTGGNALKFYSSVRINIRKSTAIKNGDEVVGYRTVTKVVKNKLAPPFRTAEFDIIFNKGINWAGDVLDLAVEEKIVNRSGSWYSYGDIKLGQGRDKVVEFLEENPDILVDLEAALLSEVYGTEEDNENQKKTEGKSKEKEVGKEKEGEAKKNPKTKKGEKKTIST
ncbi:MAG: recombinase RecA [Planctomycetota bacterium]|nr:MAG: recombinase RecA [Planctomycetota bacterium]